MAQPKTLTVLQIAVLRWIAGGCQSDDAPSDYVRISAAALRGRGLVTTKGRGPTWSARITPTGTEYLAKVDGPNPPLPRKANRPQGDPLLDEIIAAGGTKRVPRKGLFDPTRVNYEQWAADTQRRNRVPTGSWLEVCPSSDTELDINLVTPPSDAVQPVAPVHVRDQVARFHPVVREFRDLKVRREVSMAQLPRALRIMQAIAEEAERRGHSLSIAPNRDDGRGSIAWSGPTDGHFRITAGRHTQTVRLFEHGLPSAQFREWRAYHVGTSHKTKARTPAETDGGATGRLKLELLGYDGSGRPKSWADRKNRTVEDALGDFFWEVEARSYQIERRILAERRAADEQLRLWNLAKAEALVRLNEQRCVDTLTHQMNQRRRAVEIRMFCEEALSRHRDNSTTTECAQWALKYADRIDPLNDPPCAPTPLTSAPNDKLEQFMDGWSANSPVRR